MRRDSNGLWDVVGDVKIGRPDGSDHLGDSSRAGVRLNGVPEESSSHANDDSEFGKVPAERGAHGNREGYVETSSKYTIEDKRNGAA